MYDEDPWFRRIPGAGALLFLFVVAALAYPLWHWRHLNHPLAGEMHVDLCARLAKVPLLGGFRPENFPSSGATGTCRWRDGDDKVQLDATLSTTRGSGGMDLDRMFDTWRDEAKANYGPPSEMRESGEAHQRVLSYHTYDGRERLIEDDGVLLYLRSPTLDDRELDRLVDPLRAALRAPPKP
jgi:hypothetical protein